MKYIHSNGGRSKYFPSKTRKERTNDCVIRAIALATGKDYLKIRNGLFYLAMGLGRMPNDQCVYEQFLENLGWVKCKPFRKRNGRKYVLKDIKVDKNINYIFHTSRHLTAVVKGVNMDTFKAYNWCANSYYIKAEHKHQMSKSDMLKVISDVKGVNSVSPSLPLDFIKEIYDDINKGGANGQI